jgi:hypothetical protein
MRCFTSLNVTIVSGLATIYSINLRQEIKLKIRPRLWSGKLEGKKPLGRPRVRWIYDIKLDLLEIGLDVVV